MDDLISRQAAIDIVNKYKKSHMILWGKPMVGAASIVIELEDLPPVQPDEEKISDALYNIYRQTSPHTSAEGVAAVKYYIREIYREIFGEEGPGWLKK